MSEIANRRGSFDRLRAGRSISADFRVGGVLVELVGTIERLAATLNPLRTNSVARRGVKDAEVITARLVQDERGWLRLTG